MVLEVLPMGDAASVGGGAATTCDGDGDELEIIMGHPGLWAPGLISLPEAMSMTHFVLHQVHDVLQWEWADIKEERHRLKEWGSLFKERTTSEKQKATAKRERLNKMEVMLKQEEVAIGLLDAQGQELMEKAKELLLESG
jgi:hypothetical protein